jgi:transglutaminase-like putative cysteine protease
MDLVMGIGKRVAYEPGTTDVTHTAGEALELGSGVCQDQAHVLVACCRAAGIPSRYVSGYFYAGDPGGVASPARAPAMRGPTSGWGPSRAG